MLRSQHGSPAPSDANGEPHGEFHEAAESQPLSLETQQQLQSAVAAEARTPAAAPAARRRLVRSNLVGCNMEDVK